MAEKIHKSGATATQVEIIRDETDALISSLANRLGLSTSQVAKEIHYRIQRAKEYRINPTSSEKNKSKKHHKNVCWICGNELKELADDPTEYHHIRRDLPDPHNPDNMVPIHKSCHSRHHQENPD